MSAWVETARGLAYRTYRNDGLGPESATGHWQTHEARSKLPTYSITSTEAIRAFNEAAPSSATF